MKQILTSLAVLISCATAHAEFVIDDFSHPMTTLDAFLPVPGVMASEIAFPVASGTRTTTVSPGARIIFGSGEFHFQGQGPGATANLTYTLSSILNLSAAGTHPNPLLFLDLFGSIQNSFDVDVTIGSSTTATTYAYATRNLSSPPAGSQPQSYLGTEAPALLASTVDSISITFTQVTPGGFGQFNKAPTGALISANPEPASLALLGVTGLGGWFMARRRAKKTQPVA